MQFLWALFTVLCFYSITAYTAESSVYSCRFEDDPNGFSYLRMKKYFDLSENMDMGKVDLIQNMIVTESTPTRVYQIPLLDNQTYVQMWYSANLRVDTHLSYAVRPEKFKATYNKDSQSRKIFCVELKP